MGELTARPRVSRPSRNTIAGGVESGRTTQSQQPMYPHSELRAAHGAAGGMPGGGERGGQDGGGGSTGMPGGLMNPQASTFIPIAPYGESPHTGVGNRKLHFSDAVVADCGGAAEHADMAGRAERPSRYAVPTRGAGAAG